MIFLETKIFLASVAVHETGHNSAHRLEDGPRPPFRPKSLFLIDTVKLQIVNVAPHCARDTVTLDEILQFFVASFDKHGIRPWYRAWPIPALLGGPSCKTRRATCWKPATAEVIVELFEADRSKKLKYSPQADWFFFERPHQEACPIHQQAFYDKSEVVSHAFSLDKNDRKNFDKKKYDGRVSVLKFLIMGKFKFSKKLVVVFPTYEERFSAKKATQISQKWRK